MKNESWWDAYSYDETKLQYVIPNYKIERFKNEVESLKSQLKQKDEALKEARDFVLTFKDFVAYHDNKTFENHTSLIEDLGYWLEKNKG